jgi:hypothetical protein
LEKLGGVGFIFIVDFANAQAFTEIAIFFIHPTIELLRARFMIHRPRNFGALSQRLRFGSA